MEKDTFLGGSRVLDLTDGGRMLCGKLLGDLGADVIKIEPPGGSPSRNAPPFYHDIADPEKSLEWLYLGLNKRGVTLNLETDAGSDVFKRLVATADFVVESYEPGYMERLGLGYRELEKINPGVVVCSITPFGQTGPYVGYKTPDLVGVSLAGMVRIHGELDGPPTRISTPVFHYLGAIHGALGCMMAHYHRELHGEGQYVDVSCQQAVVLALRNAVEMWDVGGINPRGTGPHILVPLPGTDEPIKLPSILPCKDGHIVAMLFGRPSVEALIAMANSEGMALELADVFQEETVSPLTIPPEFDIYGSLGRFFLTKTKAELLDAAVTNDILLMPVNTAEEVAASPQLAFRGFWRRMTHPDLDDTLTYPGWPVLWTGMPAYQPQRRAPLVGEHNAEVYQAELGLSDAEMASLRERGVV